MTPQRRIRMQRNLAFLLFGFAYGWLVRDFPYWGE